MSFKEEFRSLSGKLACGKLSKKNFLALGDNATKDQQDLQKNVKCKLLVFGLVSGSFTDLDSKAKVEVKDELFVWGVSQSGFMGVDGTITGIERERRAVPLTPIRVYLKKEKMGTVVYHVPMTEVLTKVEPLVAERDAEYLAKIRNYIKDTNDYVNQKYAEALQAKAANGDFAQVHKVVNAVAANTFHNDPLDDLG